MSTARRVAFGVSSCSSIKGEIAAGRTASLRVGVGPVEPVPVRVTVPDCQRDETALPRPEHVLAPRLR
jgi:hypothetical protein